jgi:hypothetical protein
LKHDYGIGFEIGHVNALSLFFDGGMLPTHEPSNVRKEEASIRIVGICVRFGKLVMDPMVPTPFMNVILGIIFEHVIFDLHYLDDCLQDELVLP